MVEQPGVSAIGEDLILGGGHQLGSVPCCQFADIRHADGCFGFRAKAAEGALAQVQCDCPGAAVIAARESASRAGRRGRARVLQVWEINLWPSTGLAGHLSRRVRVVRGNDARGQAFAQDVEHGA